MLVTTHYLDEAEYCHRIMLMHEGQKIAGGSPRELKADHITDTLLEIVSTDSGRCAEILLPRERVHDCSFFGTKLHILVSKEINGPEKVKKVIAHSDIILCLFGIITIVSINLVPDKNMVVVFTSALPERLFIMP